MHNNYTVSSLSLSLSFSLDIEVLQKEAAVKLKELSKAEKLTKKLHDELQSLNTHVATNMVSKTDFEHYKRAVNEKVTKYNFSKRKLTL